MVPTVHVYDIWEQELNIKLVSNRSVCSDWGLKQDVDRTDLQGENNNANFDRELPTVDEVAVEQEKPGCDDTQN
eukprot:1380418-Amorphochlora_amoeboformis.AAC.1